MVLASSPGPAAHASHKAWLATQDDRILADALALWRVSMLSLTERKRRIFGLWDERAEPAEVRTAGDEIQALAAREARPRIEGLIRRLAPKGSPQKFTAAELELLKGGRASRPPLRPLRRALNTGTSGMSPGTYAVPVDRRRNCAVRGAACVRSCCPGADRRRSNMQPLARDEYWRVTELLRAAPMNTLFARAVVENHCRGEVLVDRVDRPGVVHIIHPYGMSLLLGAAGSRLDPRSLEAVLSRHRDAPEWLQVFPPEWAERIVGSPRADVERSTRVNFEFHRERFLAFRAAHPVSPFPIGALDRSMFDAARGSVIPRSFWDDAEQFLRGGLGFAVLLDGEPASVAFSSFVIDRELELGIETAEQHRGRGLALWVCAALIDECLARDLRPVWACRLENTASYRLAERLGFAPSRYLPYFRLPALAAPS